MKMNDEKFLKLSNGVVMPKVGFGTDCTFIFLSKNPFVTIKKYYIDIIKNNKYQLKRDKSLKKIVNHSVENGCYLFDTAHAYGQSERILGKALKHNLREEYFISTKVSNEQQRGGNIRAALESSLNRLNLDYIDLYLLHWPHPGLFQESWRQMEELYKEGLIRSIGVCNFHQHHLEELKKSAEIMPMVNQFECHPLMSQNELRQYCRDNGIQVMAYTPTARMNRGIMESETIKKIALAHNKGIAQVVIRWHIQSGNIPVINTTNEKHLIENMNVFDFELTQDEMDLIDGLNVNMRLRYNPDTCDYTKL